LPRRSALWGLCAVALLAALLVAACSSSSDAARRTPTPRSQHSATSTPRSNVAGASLTPQPTPSFDFPNRWGYNPRESTGVLDTLPRYRALPPGYRIETVVSGLQRPTGLAFTPDGRMLVIEQDGNVRLVEDGRLQPEPYFVADAYMPEGDEIIELGLVGITVDPGFAANGYVYVYYTTEHPERRTVLARITDNGTTASGLTEIMSLEADPGCCHISGSMRFAPDGTLFVSVGDHQREEDAQDIGKPFGKILRINPDGSAPDDNPFADDDDADPRVFAYGLRNPFDFALHPAQNRIFATENGFIGQDAVIEIKPGANYGWPGYDIAVPLEQIEQPLIFFNEATGPSGMELYLSDRLPEFTGLLFFCQFHRGGALHAVSFNLAGGVDEDVIVAPGCTSDVLTGPDGFLYFIDYVSGTVYRIAEG
jgi:glucose/arabinose dehydrogenase